MNISSYMPVDVFYGKNALLENGKELKSSAAVSYSYKPHRRQKSGALTTP